MPIKNNRRYYIHYKLRKAGYRVNTKGKTVSVHHIEFENKTTPKLFSKYFDELSKSGYGIQSSII